MSEFHVQVVRVGEITKHPNADSLGLTKVFDYPVVVRLGDFKPGDLAVYVPVDSIVPSDAPQWAFLDGHCRVKAKKLRGIFSMGLLTHADPSWVEGQDVCEAMRITKYDPPEPMTTGGENEPDPGYMPCYTDIEGLRRYPDVLIPGEEVVITEKRHGANGRWTYQDGRLWCASHHNWKKLDEVVLWWKVAKLYDLERKLQRRPDLGFCGEVFGQVQDLKYNATNKNPLFLELFDALDIKTKRYLDFDDFVTAAHDVDLPLVPILFRGPWSPDLRSHAEGPTTTVGANHVREGIVIRPVKERWDDRIGRVVLKIHGEGYLTRKEGSTKPPYNDKHAQQIKVEKRKVD
jgi:RNA ligase (TIGR02306 family)